MKNHLACLAILLTVILSAVCNCITIPPPAQQEPATVHLATGADPQSHITAHGTGTSTDAWSDEDSPVPVSANDPVWGNRDAPVTIVVFGEFECPFCGRWQSSMDAIKAQYGPELVRVVWKHFPLWIHRNARAAGIAAETVRALGGNQAFWSFHTSAFRNQTKLTRENYEMWARRAGVDAQAFADAFERETYADKVDADTALGRRLGVSGIPRSFINGVTLVGAQPLDDVTSIIDQQLAVASALAAAGTPSDRVYVEASKANRAQEPTDAAASAIQDNAPRAAAPTPPSTVWNIPIGRSPSRGPADALVTLVVFSDFQCPFCKRVELTYAQIMQEYQGKVRIVWKDLPLAFHARALPAAMFATEARKQKGDRGFWDAHDLLFDNQPRFDMTDFEQYARTLRLNWPAVKNAVEMETHKPTIRADTMLAEGTNTTGTPATFINGRRLSGAQPIEVFRAMIDEEMAKAESLVRAGTAKNAVYAEIMKTAQMPAPPAPTAIP